MALPTREEVLDAIRRCAKTLGRAPSRADFKSESGMTEYQFLQHFPSWREAVRAAGWQASPSNVRLSDEELLTEWGQAVRRLRRIPTRDGYRRDGRFSAAVFEKHFGPWSSIPDRFRAFAAGKSEWTDVVALLPVVQGAAGRAPVPATSTRHVATSTSGGSRPAHAKLTDRPTYGNPMDFRGLRHEPVNEGGVVFLFGMVARELGYSVEAVQAGFPDCEAKRQVGPGRWQRVRIEFEFESRNFREHGHAPDGCDLIVCWKHNWAECPADIEVVELSTVIGGLSAADE